MTMTFSVAHSIESDGSLEQIDVNSISSRSLSHSVRENFYLLRSKLEPPKQTPAVRRPRIQNILARSVDQFPATLISGRSGTGKTSIASAFAAACTNVSWYTVESSDREWPVFSRYFHDMVTGGSDEDLTAEENGNEATGSSEFEIARIVLNSFKRAYKSKSPGVRLLVLDDIHHVFDTEWFDNFFELLLYSLPEDHRLLMLCRSKPPGPLWRLRSKQMLNVIDEKVIEFTGKETEELFAQYGLSTEVARAVNRRCYGRVSRLIQFAEQALSDTI